MKDKSGIVSLGWGEIQRQAQHSALGGYSKSESVTVTVLVPPSDDVCSIMQILVFGRLCFKGGSHATINKSSFRADVRRDV